MKGKMIRHKVVYPHRKVKASDISDEVMLGMFLLEDRTESISSLFPAFPKSVILAKLNNLANRGYLAKGTSNHFVLTDYGYASIRGTHE